MYPRGTPDDEHANMEATIIPGATAEQKSALIRWFNGLSPWQRRGVLAFVSLLIVGILAGMSLMLRSAAPPRQAGNPTSQAQTTTSPELATSAPSAAASPASMPTAAQPTPTTTIPGMKVVGVLDDYEVLGPWFLRWTKDKGTANEKEYFCAKLFSDPAMTKAIKITVGIVVVCNDDYVIVLNNPNPDTVEIRVVTNFADGADPMVTGDPNTYDDNITGFMKGWMISRLNVPTRPAPRTHIFDNPDDGITGCAEPKSYLSTVWGNVVTKDHKPVAGAVVKVVSKGGYPITLVTNRKGQFSTKTTLACGEWRIDYGGVTKIGYVHVSGGAYDGYGAQIVAP